MTEKLYYKDAYISYFKATVIDVLNKGNEYAIVLDKTAFFPEEGGQYSDKGMIANVPVLNVKEEDGVIYHYAAIPIEKGMAVDCQVNFVERYEKMQIHTAEHILSGLINKHYALDNVGFHLGEEDVTMDINSPLTRAELDVIEREANEIVYKNLAVRAYFPNSEQLQVIKYRSKLDIKEKVRIVEIGDCDTCACCAPHVNTTGEIGIIKILDFEGLRGGIRIHITAGRRAFRMINDYYESIRRISAMLSVKKENVSEAVSNLLTDFTEQKRAFSEYRSLQIRKKAEDTLYERGNNVILLPDATIPEMIEYANIATEKVQGILVLLSGEDFRYKYVISSKCCDLRAKAAEINKCLLGKGGGRSNMIQGSFGSTLDDIKKYFIHLRED